MHAADEVVKGNSYGQKLKYKSREDHVFSRKQLQTQKDVFFFEVSSSPLPDNGTFLCEWNNSRVPVELQRGMDVIFRILRRLRLTCRAGQSGSTSNFGRRRPSAFRLPKSLFEDAKMLPLEVDGGLVTFTKAFKF